MQPSNTNNVTSPNCGPRTWVNPDNELTFIDVVTFPQRLIDNIEAINQWGIDRQLVREHGCTALAQIKKLKEEVNELELAIIENNEVEIVDGLGDALTVLIQISRLVQIPLCEATDRAYNQIRYRKGKMVNGIFVKEADVAC